MRWGAEPSARTPRATDARPTGALPARRQMLADALAGLTAHEKSLPAKYFYDEAGSRLFDEITELDEYYLTRAETAIMRGAASEMAAEVGADALLVEFGSGSSTKTRLLLDHLERPVGYVPIDISGTYLEGVARELRRDHPEVPILPLAADFTAPLTLPARPRPEARRVVYFPGSTIGNFRLLEACRLLARMASLAGPGGGVLIGADLVKPLDVLLPAYDDARGVTARFNLNLLARLNRELGADFDVSAFRHEAVFDDEASRIEMRLVSLCPQEVRLGGRAIRFAAGEHVVTEYSHKYTLDSFASLARAAGLATSRVWTDPDDLFSVHFLVA